MERGETSATSGSGGMVGTGAIRKETVADKETRMAKWEKQEEEPKVALSSGEIPSER